MWRICLTVPLTLMSAFEPAAHPDKVESHNSDAAIVRCLRYRCAPAWLASQLHAPRLWPEVPRSPLRHAGIVPDCRGRGITCCAIVPEVRRHRADHCPTCQRATVKPAEGVGVNARRRRRRTRRGELINELQRDLRPVAPPNVLVLLWRWRWELAIFPRHSGRAYCWRSKSAGYGAWPSSGWQPSRSHGRSRHWLVAHIRCIITAHRVRTGCAQAWIQTRSGKLPDHPPDHTAAPRRASLHLVPCWHMPRDFEGATRHPPLCLLGVTTYM